MERFWKQITIQQVLLALFLISLFFPIRYIIHNESSFLLGQYSDFTSLSLYSCDFLLLGLVLINFRKLFSKKILIIVSSFIVILGLEILLRPGPKTLSVYFAIKIIEFFLVFLLFRTQGIRTDFKRLLPLIVCLGVIQSFIAIFQFTTQHSIGLYLIGESHIGGAFPNVANIVARGAKVFRPYGTFPHPNILAGALSVTQIFNLHLLTKTKHKYTKIGLSIAVVMINLGLILSLSRIGFMALLVSGGVWFAFYLTKFGFRHRTTWFLLLFGVSIFLSLSLIYPLIRERSTFRDPATTERWYYNHLGTEMIKNKPFLGVGPGQSLIHMEQFSPTPLESWEKQPIHNFYLLTLAEFGLFIGIIILGYILYVFIRLIIFTKKAHTYEGNWQLKAALVSIFTGMLLVMAFDHYFYTIEQTQLLFWLIFGLIAGKNSNKRLVATESPTYDSLYPQ